MNRLKTFVFRQVLSHPLAWVMAFSLLMQVSGSWILPLIDRDEPRFAEASREMLRSHDWIIPRFNGNFRFDKPPLTYWFQAVSFTMFGDNEFAARLPSAVFSAATAALVYLWGVKLAGRRKALLGAFALSTSFLVLLYGRLSFADPSMIFFYTLICWSLWELSRPIVEQGNRWKILLIAGLCFGFLAKGPEVFLPLIGLIWCRCWRAEAFRFSGLQAAVCLLAALGLISIWGLPALLKTDGEFLKIGLGHHVVERSFYVLEGHGIKGWMGNVWTLPFYLLVLLLGIFPWTDIFIRRFRALCWTTRMLDFEFYLLSQAAVVLIVFTMVRTKLPHYILPVFPLLLLLIFCSGEKHVFIPLKFYVRRFAITAMACLLVTTLGFTYATQFFISKQLYKLTAGSLKPESRIITSSFDEPSLVWEFRKVSTNRVEILDASACAKSFSDEISSVLILPYENMNSISNLACKDAKYFRQTGKNLASAKRQDLALVIRP